MNYGQPAYGQPQTRSKVVFVGNLPFDFTEEQLIEVFSSVGPVVSFRLVFDHGTGKPKGFGFCEYRDADTAASALRNLQGVEVGGRGLRLDFADTDDAPPPKRFRGPGAPPAGPGLAGYGGAYGGGGGPAPPMPMQPMMGGAPPSGPGMLGAGGPMGMGAPGGAMPPAGAGGSPVVAGPPAGGYAIPPAPAGSTGPRPLPQGVPVEPGKSAIDKITETIGTMPPGQLLDIMSQMKALVTASPYEARALLTAQPQLSYALFQAMLCMGIVDPTILAKTFPAAAPGGAPAGTPTPGPAPSSYPPVAPVPAPYGGGYNAPPPGNGAYGTPPPQGAMPYPAPAPGGPASYNRPPGSGPATYDRPPPPSGPASYGGPPAPAGPAPMSAGATPDQAALIQQVMSMTDEQINGLDEASRNTILQIRAQAREAMSRR
ncbi:hypothetical protein JCM8202_001607 [Rhodotorula sphaerocarpa]